LQILFAVCKVRRSTTTSLTTGHLRPSDSSDISVFPGDNGLNPVYNETIEFDVICPPLAYIRFAVYDEDVFGDPNFVAQAVFPFESLRQGTQCECISPGLFP
jgi:hypothetical protein